MRDVDLLITVVTAAGAGGIAWGMAKAGATNSARDILQLKESVQDMKKSLDAHVSADYEVQLKQVQRLTHIETLLTDVRDAVVK